MALCSTGRDLALAHRPPIVVVGILSAVAIPKLAATRDDAEISRARTTIASLRNAISTERQKRILRGDFSDVNGSAALKLLEYGISSDD